jgi:hypothetical protein
VEDRRGGAPQRCDRQADRARRLRSTVI